MYARLLAQATQEPKPPRPTAPSWFSQQTKWLMDRKAQLCKNLATSSRGLSQRLARRLKRSIGADRKARANVAATDIQAHLQAGDKQEAYNVLKRWYRHVTGKPTHPSYCDVNEVTVTFCDLYQARPPIGDPLPFHAAPFEIPDNVPSPEEIASATRLLRNGRAPGVSGLTAEVVKSWLDKAESETDPDPTRWNYVVRLVQHVFQEDGNLPQALAHSVLVILPKPDGGRRGISLLDTVWKIIARIIQLRLRDNVQYHDAIHGLTAAHGTGTAVLELKLCMALAGVQQRPFHVAFLDIEKAFDSFHRERLLDIATAYGLGPVSRQIISSFWDMQ